MANVPFLYPPTDRQVIKNQLAAKGMRGQGMDEVKCPPRFPAFCSHNEEHLPGNSQLWGQKRIIILPGFVVSWIWRHFDNSCYGQISLSIHIHFGTFYSQLGSKQWITGNRINVISYEKKLIPNGGRVQLSEITARRKCPEGIYPCTFKTENTNKVPKDGRRQAEKENEALP